MAHSAAVNYLAGLLDQTPPQAERLLKELDRLRAEDMPPAFTFRTNDMCTKCGCPPQVLVEYDALLEGFMTESVWEHVQERIKNKILKDDPEFEVSVSIQPIPDEEQPSAYVHLSRDHTRFTVGNHYVWLKSPYKRLAIKDSIFEPPPSRTPTAAISVDRIGVWRP